MAFIVSENSLFPPAEFSAGAEVASETTATCNVPSLPAGLHGGAPLSQTVHCQQHENISLVSK